MSLPQFDNTTLSVTVSPSGNYDDLAGIYTLLSGNIADGTAVWQNENGYYLYNISKNSTE